MEGAGGGGGEPRRARRKRGWDDEGDATAAGTAAAAPAVGAALKAPEAAASASAAPKSKKLCRFWSWGSCQRTVDCPFAHGVEELTKDGLSQESNMQILVDAEKDASTKGELGKRLLLTLSAERGKLAAAQEKLAVERKKQEEQEENARAAGMRTAGTDIGDFANRLMREELEKKIAQMKAIKGASKGALPYGMGDYSVNAPDASGGYAEGEGPPAGAPGPGGGWAQAMQAKGSWQRGGSWGVDAASCGDGSSTAWGGGSTSYSTARPKPVGLVAQPPKGAAGGSWGVDAASCGDGSSTAWGGGSTGYATARPKPVGLVVQPPKGAAGSGCIGGKGKAAFTAGTAGMW